MASRRRLDHRFASTSHAIRTHRLRRRPVLEVLEGRVVLSTFTVNSLGDAGTGSNDAGDLRYCINQANADDQANTIVFDATVFSTPQTITLSGSQLELSDTGGTQTITGPAAGVTISGGGNSRVFQIDPGVTASISGLTISGGSVYGGNGGGVLNYGTATLTDCTISGSSAVSGHGYTLSGGEGGGLQNDGTANLTDCTLSGNDGEQLGGGVNNFGTANLTGCTLSGNSAASGGGASNNAYLGTANMTLTDCTVAGNSAVNGGGGGAWNWDTAELTLTDCTVSGNYGDFGGGGLAIYSYEFTAVGPVNLTDTIVASNTDPSGASDIAASNISGSDNLIGTGGSGGLANGASGNIVLTSLVDLGLAPLGNNGGPTQTMALLPGSAAIGAGVVADYPGTTTPITTDQRGDPLDSPNPDIGAFQTQSSTLIPLTFSGIDNNPSITYGASSVTISGTLADGSQAPVGETVAVTLDGVQQSATIGSGGAFSTTFTYDSSGLTVPDSPYTVNYAYQSDGNFASASTTSTLTVAPATLTVTANPETKVYGTADPALAYTATGFKYSDTAASVLTGNLARAESGTLAGEAAGSFAITQGALAADSNYTIAFTGSTLTITPASLNVTANSQTKVYGTSDPALTVAATGLVDTTVDGVAIDDTAATVLSGSLARTQAGTLAGEQAGNYMITQGRLTSDSNYTMTFTGGTLTITPATLTVTANPRTKVYGTSDPALTDNVTGLVDTTVDGETIDDTAVSVLTGNLARAQAGTLAGEQAGNYAITQGTLAADGNYTIHFTGSTLTINPAALTVTANPQTKVYGTNDPTLTDAVTGLVAKTVDGVTIDDTAGSVLTGNLARAQAGTLAGEQSGSYAITQGTLAADRNYAIKFTASTLTITPAPLTVSADPQTKVYGQSDPSLTDGVTGLVNATLDGVTIADTAATVLTGALARVPGETVVGSPYAITQGTLAANSDYTIHFTASTLTITPATLTIAANPQTKVYGRADPSLTSTATGFVNTTVDGVMIDDTAANVLSGSLVRAQAGTLPGEQAGSYAITQGTLAADGNYTLSFTGGTLTITPATLTVTAKSQTKDYGDADPVLTDTVMGLVNTMVDGVTIADTAATVLTGALARAPGETVAGSPYAINQGTLAANGDYTIDFTPSTLSITPATPTISVKASGGVYTGSPLAAQATVTGVTGAAAASLEGVTPTLTYYVGSGTSGKDLGAAAPSAAGTFTVVASFPGSADYAPVQSAPVTFAIRQSATAIVLMPHAALEGKKTLSTVSLTAEIKPVAPGGGVPTGEVIFELVTKHGSKTQVKTLGDAAASGGAATLSFKPSAVLNETLRIIYSGNPDFLSSTLNPPKLTTSGIAQRRSRARSTTRAQVAPTSRDGRRYLEHGEASRAGSLRLDTE